MILGLDHIAIAVGDFEAAVDGFGRMLGHEPVLRSGDGARRARFAFPNMALEVVAPDGPGAAGDQVRARLDAAGEGMWRAAFAVDDVAAAAHLLSRRGLDVEAGDDSALVRAVGLEFTLAPAAKAPPGQTTDRPIAAVSALDHVVVHSPNPDRALAVYGARFGMDLRLDRSNATWGARQLFFRCGEAVFEVGASLKAPVTDGPDGFGGLAWRVDEPQAAHDRMAAAGFNLSELRTGRKPGTRVFTVRDAPGGVPTIMLSAEPKMERV